QIVMEGFIDIRLPAWARRLTTRALAIVPAAMVTIWYGEGGAGELFILSQGGVGLGLAFSVLPVGMFPSGRRKMKGPGFARRLTTRALAIVPAAMVTIWYGEAGTAKLLILSQVVLGLALPFSVVPLVMFTADRRKMKALASPRWFTALAALVAAIIIALNVKL